LFTWRLLQSRNDDISVFVVAGTAVDASRVPPGLTVLPVGGYDGVAFYRLAVDPWTNARTAYGITLDTPAYRQQRILYPLIVHVLSFGHVTWIPTLLVAVNFASLVLLGFLSGMLAQQLGRHALWGLLLALVPGFAISLSRDLSEILACTFAIAAVLAVEKRRFAVATVLLSCGILTRETILIVAAAIGASSLWSLLRRRTIALPWFVSIVPACVFVIWQAVLYARWGMLPVHAYPGLHFTLKGYADLLVRTSSLRNIARLHFCEGLYFGLLAVIVVIVWRSSTVRREWRIAWIAFLVLIATLPEVSWLDDAGFMRNLSEYTILSLLLILGAPRVPRAVTLVITAVLWFYVTSHMIKYG